MESVNQLIDTLNGEIKQEIVASQTVFLTGSSSMFPGMYNRSNSCVPANLLVFTLYIYRVVVVVISSSNPGSCILCDLSSNLSRSDARRAHTC